MSERLRIVTEAGAKRVFASALDWPGWSRSAKTEEAAIATLLDYAPRYRPAAIHADVVFPDAFEPRVVGRLPGNATTDFGVPEAIADEEHQPAGAEEAVRLASLVRGVWRVWDAIVASSPEQLRKGPRGGGRDRTRMVEHVLGAEVAYARRLGLSLREPTPEDRPAIEHERAELLYVIGTGMPVDNPRRKLWPVRYAVRRIAWHVLDHAWEMEDRRA